jgi:hypothetical protein
LGTELKDESFQKKFFFLKQLKSLSPF